MVKKTRKRSGQKRLFRLISEGVASVPAVYQFLSLGQKSKVIFVPGSFLFLIVAFFSELTIV
ncbi:MAG: hypothetical protein E6031_12185 [Enterococcus faecalis]|nr:hypothetical protein [Enterococcus faecalis]